MTGTSLQQILSGLATAAAMFLMLAIFRSGAYSPSKLSMALFLALSLWLAYVMTKRMVAGMTVTRSALYGPEEPIVARAVIFFAMAVATMLFTTYVVGLCVTFVVGSAHTRGAKVISLQDDDYSGRGSRQDCLRFVAAISLPDRVRTVSRCVPQAYARTGWGTGSFVRVHTVESPFGLYVGPDID